MRRCNGVGLSKVARRSPPGMYKNYGGDRCATFSGTCLLAILLLAKPANTVASENLPDLIQRITPSIVLIRTGGTRVDFARLPEGEQREPEAAGTGFLIDDQGHIVTNNHVILPHPDWPDPAIKVILHDHRELSATLVGRDEQSDLAVLKIEGIKAQPLIFADPKTVRVGQDVCAIGFAHAYELEGMPTVTRGIVSAFHRTRDEMREPKPVNLAGMIQTDAAINHGNSGGPLLNLSGEVVGVNTMSETNGQGIHLSVSGRLAKSRIAMIIADGKVTRSSLGIRVTTLPESVAGWQTRAGFALSEGAFVLKLDAQGAAAKVGMQEFDVIQQIGSHVIRSEGDLNNALVWLRPGESVEVKYRRYPEGKFDPAGMCCAMRSTGEERSVRLMLD